MPKLFEYLGLVIFFYSNEHAPIHVHAVYGESECKAEFYISEGEIIEIRIRNINGRKTLSGTKLKDFKKFLSVYGASIVAKWVDYFVYHKNVSFELISTKLK